MARVNISIPDSLYERLDRQRDRINASRVCALALEQELNMIEGRTAVTDPDIAQLIQRLQTARERWYKRGREDGKRWAVQAASRQDLYRAKEHVEGEDGAELAEYLTHRHEKLRQLFAGYDFVDAINRWLRKDEAGAEFRLPREDEHDEDDSFSPAEQPAKADVDTAGYMEGWRDVLEEIWRVVSTALR